MNDILRSSNNYSVHDQLPFLRWAPYSDRIVDYGLAKANFVPEINMTRLDDNKFTDLDLWNFKGSLDGEVGFQWEDDKLAIKLSGKRIGGDLDNFLPHRTIPAEDNYGFGSVAVGYGHRFTRGSEISLPTQMGVYVSGGYSPSVGEQSLPTQPIPIVNLLSVGAYFLGESSFSMPWYLGKFHTLNAELSVINASARSAAESEYNDIFNGDTAISAQYAIAWPYMDFGNGGRHTPEINLGTRIRLSEKSLHQPFSIEDGLIEAPYWLYATIEDRIEFPWIPIRHSIVVFTSLGGSWGGEDQIGNEIRFSMGLGGQFFFEGDLQLDVSTGFSSIQPIGESGIIDGYYPDRPYGWTVTIPKARLSWSFWESSIHRMNLDVTTEVNILERLNSYYYDRTSDFFIGIGLSGRVGSANK